MLIAELRNVLKSRFNDFRGLYFFGSQKKNIATAVSDWDFAIVFDRTIDWKFKDEVRDILYDMMLKYNIVIDSHIYSVSELRNPKTPFRESVSRDGIFYAA